MLNDILTVSEVAEYLRINPQTVYRKAKAGELPAVRIGRAIRFRRTDLEEWLRVPATGPGTGAGRPLPCSNSPRPSLKLSVGSAELRAASGGPSPASPEAEISQVIQ